MDYAISYCTILYLPIVFQGFLTNTAKSRPGLNGFNAFNGFNGHPSLYEATITLCGGGFMGSSWNLQWESVSKFPPMDGRIITLWFCEITMAMEIIEIAIVFPV